MAGEPVNPSVPGVQVPEFSREVRTPSLYMLARGSQAGAMKFDTLKDTVADVGKVGDTLLQSMTDNTLKKGVEQVQKDATSFASSQVTNDDMFADPTKGTPAGVTAATKKIEDLHNMVLAKPDLESYYHGRLQSLVQQTKAQYPGYEDVIDKQIHQITGVQPANALLQDRFNQVTRLQQQHNEEAKFQRNFMIKESGKLQAIFGDNWDKVPFTDAVKAVAKWDARDATNKADHADLEVTKARTEVGQMQVKTFLDRELGGVGQAQEMSIYHKAFPDSPGPDALLEAARKQSAPGGGGEIDQKTRAGIYQGMAQHRQVLGQIFDQTVNSPHIEWRDDDHPKGQSYAQFLPPEYLKQQKDAFIESHLHFWDAAANGDYGYLHVSKKLNEEAVDDATANLLNHQPAAAYLAAIKAKLGPEFDVSNIDFKDDKTNKMFKGANAIGVIHLNAATEPVNPAAPPPPHASMNDYYKDAETVRHNAAPPPQWVLGMATKDTTNIQNDKLDAGARINMAHHIYGLDNNEAPYLQKFEPNSRVKVFSILASPKQTETMWQLGQQDPNVWKEYSTWVKRNYGALYSRLESTISESSQSVSSPYEITFNPTSQRFEANVRPEFNRGTTTIALNRNTDREPQAVFALNAGLDLVQPVLAKDGHQISDLLTKDRPGSIGNGPVSQIVQGQQPKRTPPGVETLKEIGSAFKAWYYTRGQAAMEAYFLHERMYRPEPQMPDEKENAPGEGGAEGGAAGE